MAVIDGSIGDPTPTGAWADRVDVYRSAHAELRGAGLITDATPEDVLALAQWFAGNETA